MGCCNSRKPPPLTETQDLSFNALNASIDSAANSGTRDGGRHSVRIVLKEIHLTKNTERVTKEACDLSVRIKIADFVCQSRVIEQPSQHTTMREELKSAMNREEDVAEIIGYLTTFFTAYSLNNEVMITSIKTLQSLSAITYFREEIAAQVKFELLAKVQRRYADDVYKCKFIVAIVRDLAGTQSKLQQPDQLLIAVEILEDIMKRHIDAGSILELALTALKTASGTRDSAVCRKLATHALLELLVEVLDRHAAEPKLASQTLSLCSTLKSHSDSTAAFLNSHAKYQAHASKEDIS